jgi:hypothetical protein
LKNFLAAIGMIKIVPSKKTSISFQFNPKNHENLTCKFPFAIFRISTTILCIDNLTLSANLANRKIPRRKIMIGNRDPEK